MANSSLELLKVGLKQRGINGPMNPLAEEMCRVIDHFNDQHWHDRDRYRKENNELKARVAELERKGTPA